MNSDRPATSPSRNRRRKESVRALLETRDRDAVERWAGSERHPLRPLASLLFDERRLIRWRAIEAIGWTAPREHGRDPERVRRFIRRILWLMNDESGGICWNGPEVIGEVLYNVSGLIGEYGQLLPSFFPEQPFESGSRWAVARVATRDRRPFAGSRDALLKSLDHPDPTIRGYSLLALNAIGASMAWQQREMLQRDASVLSIYNFESGDFVAKSISQLV